MGGNVGVPKKEKEDSVVTGLVGWSFGDVSDNGRDNDSQGDSQYEVEIDPREYLLEEYRRIYSMRIWWWTSETKERKAQQRVVKWLGMKQQAGMGRRRYIPSTP